VEQLLLQKFEIDIDSCVSMPFRFFITILHVKGVMQKCLREEFLFSVPEIILNRGILES